MLEWSPRLWRRGFESWCNQQREDNGSSEVSNGEYQKGKGSYTSRALPYLVDFRRCHMWVRLEVRLYVDFANVGGDIEQEREPPNPSKELYLADFRNLGRQTTNGFVQRRKEGDDASLLLGRISFEPGIPFTDCCARNSHSDDQGEGGQDAEYLELSVAEEGHDTWKVDIAGEVAQDVAHTRQSRCPCVCIILLMRWRIVNYKGPYACLD